MTTDQTDTTKTNDGTLDDREFMRSARLLAEHWGCTVREAVRRASLGDGEPSV